MAKEQQWEAVAHPMNKGMNSHRKWGFFLFLFYNDCYSSQETETLTEQIVQFSPPSSYTCATASKKDLFTKIKASPRTLGIICGSTVPIKSLYFNVSLQVIK